MPISLNVYMHVRNLPLCICMCRSVHKYIWLFHQAFGRSLSPGCMTIFLCLSVCLSVFLSAWLSNPSHRVTCPRAESCSLLESIHTSSFLTRRPRMWRSLKVELWAYSCFLWSTPGAPWWRGRVCLNTKPFLRPRLFNTSTVSGWKWLLKNWNRLLSHCL